MKTTHAGVARRPLVIALGMGFLWCAFIYALYSEAVADKAANTERLALMQTRTLYTMITDARSWNSAHGGVYVPESDFGRPNPHIPEGQRAVDTTDGRRLVLMNPAYMSRQIADISAGKGASFRITSRSPLRPENIADHWETAALDSCMGGQAEIFTIMEEDGGLYYRYIAPLRAEHACLACHASNREGDVRGGISVRLDARPFIEEARQHEASLGLAFSLMGLTGFFGIGGVSLAVSRRRFLAEEASRIKSNFLANMSHDMRTPLAGILGMSELAPGAASRAEREEIARNLQAAGHALLDMLSDLTDHALLDAGRLRLTKHVFSPRAMLGDCLALITPACRMKKLSLSLVVNENVPATLAGDSFRLRQAIGNLLSNAVKFTASGSIRVSARVEAFNLKKMNLCFEVADTGPGIDINGEDKNIFERFEQGRAAHAQRIPGTGLGLSIAREIARMMGGDVEVRPNPGGGAVFALRVILDAAETDRIGAYDAVISEEAALCANAAETDRAGPVREISAGSDAAAAAKDSLSAVAAVSSAAPRRVLIAEDNAVNAYFACEIFSRAGHAAAMARNGDDVLRLLREHRPDLLLLDLRMPGPDGFALLEMIRAGRTTAPADLPVFVLSASLGAEDCARLDRLGASGRFLKPASGRELLAMVDFLPAPGEQAAAEAAMNSAHDGEAAMEFVHDKQAALEAMDGREDLLLRLGGIFCGELPDHIRALEQAATENDIPETLRLAHALKNSAATLCFMRLKTAAASVEEAARQGRVDHGGIRRVIEEAECAGAAFYKTS